MTDQMAAVVVRTMAASARAVVGALCIGNGDQCSKWVDGDIDEETVERRIAAAMEPATATKQSPGSTRALATNDGLFDGVLYTLLQRIVAAGFEVSKLSGNGHYRAIKPALGGFHAYDFWPSTGKWKATNSRTPAEIGLDKFVETLRRVA